MEIVSGRFSVDRTSRVQEEALRVGGCRCKAAAGAGHSNFRSHVKVAPVGKKGTTAEAATMNNPRP